MQPATRRQLAGVACLAAVALGAALLFSPGNVIGALEGLAGRPLVFGLALVAVYLARPFLLWPVSSIAVVLGFLYDPLLAMPIALGGAALTGLPPYALARWADADAGLLGTLADTGRDVVDAVGETRGVIAGRFAPIPGDVVSYKAGLAGVSLGPFLAGTVVGEIPWAIVAILAGNSMRTLSISGFALDPGLVLGLAALAVLLVWKPAYRHMVEGTPAE